MAFNLTKAEAKRHEEIIAKLTEIRDSMEPAREAADEEITEEWEKVVEAIDTFNEARRIIFEANINPVVNAYNAALEEAREFTGEIAQRFDTEIDMKTEKWSESGRGEAAVRLKDEWERVELEDLDIDCPDDIEIPAPEPLEEVEMDEAERLETLPTELDV